MLRNSCTDPFFNQLIETPETKILVLCESLIDFFLPKMYTQIDPVINNLSFAFEENPSLVETSGEKKG